MISSHIKHFSILISYLLLSTGSVFASDVETQVNQGGPHNNASAKEKKKCKTETFPDVTNYGKAFLGEFSDDDWAVTQNIAIKV